MEKKRLKAEKKRMKELRKHETKSSKTMQGLGPEDEADALSYLHATLHYPKEVRSGCDLKAEKRELERITPETLRKDSEGIGIAFQKLALMKSSRQEGTIRRLAGLWRETHRRE